MKKLVNRYRELIAVKERRDGRKYSNREVSQTLGLAKYTVDSYGRNDVTRYDAHVVLALCGFLECDAQDFFRIEEVAEDTEDPGETETAMRDFA